MERKTIIIIRILTLLICLSIVVFVVVPHHKTESQNVEYAENYIAERTIGSKSKFELHEIKNVYLDDGENRLYSKEKPENPIGGVLRAIADYWDPDLKYRYITFKVTDENNDISYLYLNVDAYSGFIWSDEGIIWENW